MNAIRKTGGRNEGMTLLEVMVATSILVIVAGMLFTVALSTARSVGTQESKITGQDEIRTAMSRIIRDLRQASRSSINFGGLPAGSITYRRADDLDGNGSAVDANGNLELTPPITLTRDFGDANGDGVTGQQLVMIDGANNLLTSPLCNNLCANEDTNGDGVLAASEDTNANNRLDRGIWFEQDDTGQGVIVTIETQHRSSPQDPWIVSSLRQQVVPRNP